MESPGRWKAVEETLAKELSPPHGPHRAKAGGAEGSLLSQLISLFSPARPDFSSAQELGHPHPRPQRWSCWGPAPLGGWSSWKGARGGEKRQDYPGPTEPPGRLAGRLQHSRQSFRLLEAGSPGSQVGEGERRVREPCSSLRAPPPRASATCQRALGAPARPLQPVGAARGSLPNPSAPGARGARGRGRRVLPSPGTKVLRKRQMTATGKGM